MTVPKAVNTYVFIIKDEVEKEKDGMFIPGTGRAKPNKGIIFSVGGKVTDPDIKKGKGMSALFHKGIGQEIEVEGKNYLVLNEHEIIGVI